MASISSADEISNVYPSPIAFSLAFICLVFIVSTAFFVIDVLSNHSLSQEKSLSNVSFSSNLFPVITQRPWKSNTQHSFVPNSQIYPDFLPEMDELQPSSDLILISRISPPPSPTNAGYTEQEALTSVQMALKMKAQGKTEKARKLFLHALAIQPCHSEVLLHYGEFLEENEKDIIRADHLYLRALTFCPHHSQALLNRKRTLPVVETMDRELLDRIDKKVSELLKMNHNSSTFKRLKKEIYFLHIYHTVAIEGNTMTLAEMRKVIETKLSVYGKSIMEHNEVLGLESALQYMNKTFVNHPDPLSVFDILQIHRRVLGHVDPESAGTLRKGQVFVGKHVPPPPSELESLMNEFVDWLESETVVDLHPVRKAGLAHYKLAHIHPFVDGNGRTARLIMNLILMKAGYPPIIIRKQDRAVYINALQLANAGDVRPFIRFIGQCTECMLDVYLKAKEQDFASLLSLDPLVEYSDIIPI